MTSIFRPEYRQLDDFEKKKIEDIKACAEAMLAAMCRSPGGFMYPYGDNKYHSQAVIKLEEAVMWAVKGVTAP
jgi:hypothetical protein